MCLLGLLLSPCRTCVLHLRDELAPLLAYAKREGLDNTCRVILNLNEFSFVD